MPKKNDFKLDVVSVRLVKEISYLLNSRRTEQSYSVTYPAEK